MGVIIRNGIEYSGAGGMGGGGCDCGEIIYLTQEAYDALPESKLTDGVEYRITDANTSTTAARNIAYDNSESGIEATSVQGAIDSVSNSLEWKFLGTASSTNEITIPNDCNEISAIGYIINSTTYKNPLFTIPRTTLTDGYYTVGGFGNSQVSNSIVRLSVTNNIIKVYKVFTGSSTTEDRTTEYRVEIYCR